MKKSAQAPRSQAPRTVDEYIAGFPLRVQALLKKIRTTIRKAAPGVEDKISYRIAGFFLNGKVLIYTAAFAKHIGIYPAPRGVDEFKEELAGYGGGKGTVQFPLDQPIPYDLIRRIVKFRAKQISESAKANTNEKTKPSIKPTKRIRLKQ